MKLLGTLSEMGENKRMHLASQREAGRTDALPCILVTEPTFHDDRSELKAEAPENTAREGSG